MASWSQRMKSLQVDVNHISTKIWLLEISTYKSFYICTYPAYSWTFIPIFTFLNILFSPQIDEVSFFLHLQRLAFLILSSSIFPSCNNPHCPRDMPFFSGVPYGWSGPTLPEGQWEPVVEASQASLPGHSGLGSRSPKHKACLRFL